MPRKISFLFERRRLYRTVFQTEEGKRVLADIFDACGVGRQIAVPGDPHGTYFNDGMRRVGLRIASILDMTDEEIIRLAGQGREQNHVAED